MSASGIVLTGLGVWLLFQLFGGKLLERMNVLAPVEG